MRWLRAASGCSWPAVCIWPNWATTEPVMRSLTARDS
jgi:hypothetical protein